MQRKIILVGLCMLLIATLVLTSCATTTAPATVTSTTTATATTTSTKATTTTTTVAKSTTTTAALTEPVLGGTLTYFGEYANGSPPSWDDVTTAGVSATDFWSNPYGESLLKGDINKYGPRGNNTFSFKFDLVSQFLQYYGPSLATSWELTSTPLGVIYHLRKGVMFTGNTNIGMAPREFTADDVVFHWNRLKTDSAIKARYSYIQSITATNKYTVTVIWNTFYAQWESPVGPDGGVQARIIPQEVVKAGANNWQNQSGTGPFILTDYVSGSYASYTKNPNYWGTTIINGKTYQEPLIANVIYPIIADESTQVASLRTGKIDMWPYLPVSYQSSLANTSPGLVMNKWLTGRVNWVRFNTIGTSIYNNKDIRRAMWMATDLKAIADSVYQGGDINAFPFARGTPEYTPVDQLPAGDQELFTYDVTKAKQLIASAGYPNGFTVELTIDPTNIMHDLADVLVSQWAKAGVTLTIDALNATAYTAANSKVTYKDSIMATYSTDSTWAMLYAIRPGSEGCAVNDPVFNNMYDTAQQAQDLNAQTAQKKAMGVYFLDNAYGLGFVNPNKVSCYWPWLKNYYGEITAGNYGDIMPMVTQMWIDQNLKKSMGY